MASTRVGSRRAAIVGYRLAGTPTWSRPCLRRA